MMKKPDKPNPQDFWNSFSGMNASPQQTQMVAALLDEAQRLGALHDERIIQLVKTLVARPWDMELIGYLNEALQPYRIEEIIHPDTFRPYPGSETGLDQGNIFLGEIRETGLLYQIYVHYLPHVLITGMTGSGKTYFTYGFLEPLAKYLPIIMVSVKPSDARLLIDPPIFDQAFPVEELKLSLFTPPPGVNEESFIRDVLELFAKIYGLQLSRSILHETSDELYTLYKDCSRRKKENLTFTPKALYAALKRKRSKYADSVTAAFDIFCRVTGDIFEWAAGFPMEYLFCRKSTLIFVNSFSDDRVGRLFVDWITMWIAKFLEANGPNDGSPQVIIVLDDGHRFLSQVNEKDCIMPLTHQYLTIRQAGVRLVVVSQCPADLASAVLSQSGMIIQVGGLVTYQDCRTMTAAFGMDPEDWQRLQTVGKAEFVARESLGRYDRPFSGFVRPFPQPSGNFSEATRKYMMEPILKSFPIVPALSLEEAERMLNISAKGSVPARIPGQLSDESKRLAQDVITYPFDTLNVRYQRLGIAGRKAQQAKEELINSGLVKEYKIPKRGGNPILLEPLPALASVLNQALPNTGKGGFLHAFAQNTVMNRLQQLKHTNIRKEKFFGSKAVDVVAVDNKGMLAGFEIAVSLSNLVDNIEKDFLCQPSFSMIVTVCMSAAEVRQAERMVAAANGLKSFASRIRIDSLAEWLS